MDFIVVVVLTLLFGLSTSLNLWELKPEEIALLQFDSRPLKGYWLTAARWNSHYCETHGHKFIYYTSNSDCKFESEPLASPWCKVKAMLTANSDFPRIKLFIYMDSDAVIDYKFFNTSINIFVKTMQTKLNWDPLVKPMVFNQDGPCWWCTLVKNVGYSVCLNAGTVMWFRHEKSLQVLEDWWKASMDPYEGNPIKRRFRLKWPWEQDRQMAVYNRTPEYIQIASQPERMHMMTKPGDWCLSHLPISGCLISHHCEGAYSKKRLQGLYDLDDKHKHNKRSSRRGNAKNSHFGFDIEVLQ